MQRIVRDDEGEGISISIGAVQRDCLGCILVRCHRLGVGNWCTVWGLLALARAASVHDGLDFRSGEGAVENLDLINKALPKARELTIYVHCSTYAYWRGTVIYRSNSREGARNRRGRNLHA